MKPKLPIGYWLKQADNLLTEQINQAHAAHGISRFDWQVLNLLKETGGINRAQGFETMQTFVDASSFDAILARLHERGWVEPGQHSENHSIWRLTEDGQHQYANILMKQQEIRKQAMQGISEEDYVTTMRVLQSIVQNLGGDKESPPVKSDNS